MLCLCLLYPAALLQPTLAPRCAVAANSAPPRALPARLDIGGRQPIEKKRIFRSFDDARQMARAMGLSSKEEWDEYSCPGSYRLPKQPDDTWSQEWQGWEDWLGVPRPYAEACGEVRRLGLTTQAAYVAHATGEPGARFPVRPDLYYRDAWQGWTAFLSVEGKE